MSSFYDVEMALEVLRKKIQKNIGAMDVPLKVEVSGNHLKIHVESDDEEALIAWAEEHQDDFD